MIKAALRSVCRYRVVAIGLDSRGTIISLATNTPRLSSRGYHAEERVIHRSPLSLTTIQIMRVGSKGETLPIDPCVKCQRLASKRQVRIERFDG